MMLLMVVEGVVWDPGDGELIGVEKRAMRSPVGGRRRGGVAAVWSVRARIVPHAHRETSAIRARAQVKPRRSTRRVLIIFGDKKWMIGAGSSGRKAGSEVAQARAGGQISDAAPAD
jgi:hypothetical protein